jgi:hypothetical protein
MNKIWIQPFRTEEEKHIRKSINTALRWGHQFREKFGIAKDYSRAGFNQQVLSGDYRKNKVNAKWKMQVFAQQSQDPEVRHLVLVPDADLQAIFAPDLSALGQAWTPQVLADIKSSFASVVRPS